MAKSGDKGKRDYGTGYLKERNGKWVISYRVFGQQKWETFASELDAEARLIEVRKMREEQRELELLGMPFDVYAREWLEKQNVSDGRYGELRRHIENHLIPAFGKDLLHQVDENSVTQYIIHKSKGDIPVEGKAKKKLSGTTINKHKALLTAILDRAVRDGFVKHNPLKGTKGAAKDEEPPRYIADEDLKRIFKATPMKHRMVFRFMLETGCRLSEALAITWSDYEEVERKVHIRRGLKRMGRTGAKVSAGGPKTFKSYRWLKVSERFDELLMEHKAATKDIPNPKKLIFPNEVGNYQNASNLRNRVWNQALEDAGVDQTFRQHELRHTFATRHLWHGTPVKLISYWLGHRDVKTTLSIYAHVVVEAQELVADLMGDVEAN